MFSILESNRLSNSFVNDREKFYKIVQQIYSLFNDIIIKKQQQQEKNNNSNKKYARSISRDFPKNFFSSGFSFNLILCNVKNIWNLYMFFAAEIYKIVRCYFCSMFVFFRKGTVAKSGSTILRGQRTIHTYSNRNIIVRKLLPPGKPKLLFRLEVPCFFPRKHFEKSIGS